jgi:hypothetical protein
MTLLLSARELIDVWDESALEHHLMRSLVLLRAIHPETTVNELANEPLGLVNERLFRFRETAFGPRLDGYFECGVCLDPVEVEFDTSVLTAAAHSPNPSSAIVRPVNISDLFAVIDASDPVATLIERCTNDAAGSREEIAKRLLALDPLSEIVLDVTCPSCGARDKVIIDVGLYLWEELARRVAQTLDDVDLLARTYGWDENEILDLTPTRRSAYVERALR